jgi:hypothetical protein
MRDIPPETRWQIASISASILPVLCTSILRKRLVKDCDHLAEEIWCNVGAEVAAIAKGLDLPVNPADQLATSLLEILRTVFGIEFRGEILDLSTDRAVILIRHCPFLIRSMELGEGTAAIFHPCLAFCVSATEALHRDFSVRFVRAMCMGDRNCEMRVAKKEDLERTETGQ